MITKGTRPEDLSHADGVYFNLPGVVVVRWDAACQAVILEAQGWSDSTEFQAASEAVIVGLKQHSASRFLGNGRSLKVVKQSDQDWMTHNWMPRALAAGLRRMALVIPMSALAHTNLEQMVNKVPGSALDVAYFATVEEAKEWLAAPQTIPHGNGVDKSHA